MPKQRKSGGFQERSQKSGMKPRKGPHGRNDQGNASEVKRRMRPEVFVARLNARRTNA